MAIAAIALTGAARAEPTGGECPIDFAALTAPAVFAREPVPVWRGRPAIPDVSQGKAHLFRTMLRTYGRGPSNFAGHYRLVEIGCGAASTCFAIVDSRTGRVTFDRRLRNVGALFVDSDAEFATLNYRPNSRLLIVIGAPNEENVGVHTYRWNGDRLHLLRSIPRATLCSGNGARR